MRKSLFRYREENQEQIQMIPTAIGRPTAKAPPIARVKAESKFTPGRT
jgi:hypothetical protein